MKDDLAPHTHERTQPDLFVHLGKTHALMAERGLDPGLSTLIELRASQMNRCAFCVDLHLAQARKAGIPQDKLDRLIVWRDVDLFSAAERAVLAWTEALTDLQPAADFEPLRADLRAHFSDAEISVITADIGMINLWNRVQRSQH